MRTRQAAAPCALFEAVIDELRGAATPLALVVEDAHGAVDATLDLPKYLGRRDGRTHALLTASFRDDKVGATHPPAAHAFVWAFASYQRMLERDCARSIEQGRRALAVAGAPGDKATVARAELHTGAAGNLRGAANVPALIGSSLGELMPLAEADSGADAEVPPTDGCAAHEGCWGESQSGQSGAAIWAAFPSPQKLRVGILRVPAALVLPPPRERTPPCPAT